MTDTLRNTQNSIMSQKEDGAVFQRMILIVPYRAQEQVKRIETSFENINIEGLGLPNSRYLNTKELTAEDKVNKDLDFLGGFELMDKEMRMYVIEGLSGEGHSMDLFYKANEREHTNDRRFKMIFNPDIKFKSRLYQAFNCAIKKIKLRDSLTKIMSEPDIYLRSKVPEDMYDTL